MAAQPAAKVLAGSFDRRAIRLERLGDEAQRLRKKGYLSQGSVDSIYESAFLNLVTSFERFLEELFYSCLLGSSGIPGTSGMVVFRDRSQAESIVLGGKPFIDWLPYRENAIRIGDRFLNNSPFSRLERQGRENDKMREMSIIRNAIAHESGSARKRFAPLTSSLRARRRTPAGLLQSWRQGVTVHSLYVTDLRVIVNALAADTTAAAKILLSPEDPYPTGNAPGKGRYCCTICGGTVVLRATRAPLQGCVVCQSQRPGRAQWRRIY